MKFKKGLLEALCEAAKSVYPDEFLAMLSVKKDPALVEEFVVVPAIFGKNFSSFRPDLLPFDFKIVGTIHSHPSRNNSPSQADLRVFARGRVNLIIGLPYALDSIRAFDNFGKELSLEIME